MTCFAAYGSIVGGADIAPAYTCALELGHDGPHRAAESAGVAWRDSDEHAWRPEYLPDGEQLELFPGAS